MEIREMKSILLRKIKKSPPQKKKKIIQSSYYFSAVSELQTKV